MCSVFFFFQAEDGIRDLTVTGVQTCALPILPLLADRDFALDTGAILAAVDSDVKIVFICSPNNPTGQSMARVDRSEERRVGKECRSRGSRDHLEKKDIGQEPDLSMATCSADW